jgi:hypothetical protein
MALCDGLIARRAKGARFQYRPGTGAGYNDTHIRSDVPGPSISM